MLSISSIGGVVLLVIFHGPDAGAAALDDFDLLAQSNCSPTDVLDANETVS